MKERPILFSGPMVKAILAGEKTQTRRIVKHPEYFGCLTGDCPHWDQADCNRDIAERFVSDCPYGKPGDRLWVKESFYVDLIPFDKGRLPKTKPSKEHGEDIEDSIYYRADGKCCNQIPECCCGEIGPVKWRNPMFMPRWASRITLEITDVRIERLNDINKGDALAEGISVLPLQSADDPSAWYQSAPGVHQERTAQASYAALWEEINGKSSWKQNPWVWVISFRRLV